jgi:hypothetical protein
MVSWESDNFTDIFNILRVQRETTVAGGGEVAPLHGRASMPVRTLFFFLTFTHVWVTNLTLATTHKHAELCPKIMNACVN